MNQLHREVLSILAILLVVIILIAGGSSMFFQKVEAEVKEGDPVPDLAFPADDNTTLRLTDLHGKWAVIYFYPRDDTPGCTTEAKTFSGMIGQYRAAGAIVYGINTDSGESHRKFKAKHDLKVTLLTDTRQSASRAFGIRVMAGLCARDSVLINPEGRVEKIYRGVSPSGSPAEILNYIVSKQ